MNENLKIYSAVRNPPREALKQIQAGRLKGKSDINPMWRIKSLTEQFGPCGIGWKYVIKRQWLETGGNGEISAFVDIDLFYKHDGEWSDAIPGTGGSSFVANEKNGPYTSDECFKMALTDALSVSCKALGFAADIYWESDRSKYDKPEPKEPKKEPSQVSPDIQAMVKGVYDLAAEKGYGSKSVHKTSVTMFGTDNLTSLKKEQLDEMLKKLASIPPKEAQNV